MRDLLRHRDLRLLLSGQTLSMFGDTAMLLVLAMWAKQLTGSNSIAGSVFAALVLPSLLAPFGGLVIDRFRRRTVMIVTDVVTCAVVLLLLLVRDRGDVWLLFVVAFLYGASLVFFQSARSALLPSIVPEQLLGPANGSLSTVREALRLVGPLTGAGLFAAFGGPAVAVLDAVTFLLSAGALALMRVTEPEPERGPREHHVLHDATLGARHLWAVPVLRATVVATVISLLAIGMGESVFLAVVDQGLGRPVAFLGVLMTVQGVGAVASGLAVTLLINRVGETRLVPLGLALMGAGCLLVSSRSVVVVGLGALVVGAGLPAVIIALTTLLQKHTPRPVQGRAFTAFEFLTGGPQLLSILAGAALVGFVDYRILLAVMAVGLLGAAAYSVARLRSPEPSVAVADATG